jgi:hypothetical protein
MSIVEKHELLQLHFAVVKQAHQLGPSARVANRRAWKQIWAVIQHNLSDWDEHQDASTDPGVLLVTDEFIRGLEHSPLMLQARVIWFTRRLIAKNNANSRGKQTRTHSTTPMFHQHYTGAERQCYWVWVEITTTRKAFMTGNIEKIIESHLLRRPTSAAQAEQWEMTPAGKAGLSIETLIGKSSGLPCSLHVADPR